MSHQATVALVEWNRGGHHFAFFRQFTSSLVDCGAFVVPVVSEQMQLEEMRGAFAGEWPGSVADPVVFFPSRRLKIRPRRWGVELRAWATYRRLGNALREWEARHGRSIDLVFFACMYDADFPRASLVGAGLRRPWSGLYLQGRVFHRNRHRGRAWLAQQARRTFGCRWLAAIGVLEPSMLELVSTAVPEVRNRLFPDALEPIPDSETPAAMEFRQSMLAAAAGRPIVSLLGYLQASKGVELFLRAACDPRLEDVAFFLGGTLDLSGFSAESRRRVQECMRRAPHLHCHLERLGEDQFHAALRSSDIVFAAYVDFPYSSNIQGKAAQLRKPTIVTDGGLMAERCRRYGLGECVPPNDVDSMVAAIRKVLADRASPKDRIDVAVSQDSFVAEHGLGALGDRMQWLLRSARQVG
jgi:glycosyltransferase involved in cell wall biosynthesis